MTEPRQNGFFVELKRRNVFRVAIAFVIVAWLLLQLVDILVPMLTLPEWVGRLVLLMLIIAFPISLFLAWAFELTPEGVKREKDIDRSESMTSHTGRKLDFIIIGVLAAAVVALAIGQFGNDKSTPDDEVVATETDRSIAVMPFVDLSRDQNDDFFGKGIAEELLNALAQFPELRVVARTSAFALAEQNIDLREVGERLGVAHVLEGSVRRAGEQLRITAQLIRAADGMHLWSETYDRPETDVLAIQDAIVDDISRALEIRLGVGAGAGRARRHNVDPRAYETYLQGLYLWSTRHVEGSRLAALKQLRLATELDPGFADAHAAYALSLLYTSNTPTYTGVPREDRKAVIGGALSTALELDPDNARAHAGYGTYFSKVELNLEKSAEHRQEAIRLAPNSALSHYASSLGLMVVADFDRVQRSLDRALLLDPLNVTITRVQAEIHIVAGRWGLAQAFLDKCRQGQCKIAGFNFYDLMFQTHMGQREEALVAFEALKNDDINFFNIGDEDAHRRWESVVRGLILAEDDPGFWRDLEIPTDELELNPYWFTALLRADRFDDAVAYLRRSADIHDFWTILSGQIILSEGTFQVPDEFRKFPGYRAFWDREGWREIATARIANGHPEGLPLNDDGTLVEF